MKRILPAQAEERMQCGGFAVAFLACSKRSAQKAHAAVRCTRRSAAMLRAEQLPVLRRVRSYSSSFRLRIREAAQVSFTLTLLYSRAAWWVVLLACRSEGGTPLSRNLLACACMALASCCPCRCELPKQQAAEQSGVAGCGGDEARRLQMACLQAKRGDALPAALRGTPCSAAMLSCGAVQYSALWSQNNFRSLQNPHG